MERSKIRETDNIRTFVLSRFFVEYLLALRANEAETKDGFVSEDLALGLVGEMAEMDSVRWVVGRMRLTMDERVSTSCLIYGSPLTGAATSLDGTSGLPELLHPDRKFGNASLRRHG